ncbi:MAG TPA: hypothetical protein VNT02_16520, partial [Burkholderiales bacterium]|nr:hypothetical protein [Burkholderiales bacterium]
RIDPTDDIHEAYRFLEDVQLDGRPVLVARWPSTRYHIYWPNWVKRPITLVYNQLALLAQMARGLAQGRVVIVREYTNFAMALVAPFLWPWRDRIIFNVNDNLAPQLGLLSRASLQLMRRWGFCIMLLDGAEVQGDLERRLGEMRLLTPYFAVPDRRERSARTNTRRAFRVGFVGYFRPDKGGVTALADAIRALQRLPDVEVALGYWNRGQVEQLPGDVRAQLLLRETLRYPDYLAFLAACDVIVVLATPAYLMRHSGVLVDSVSRGTPVLCPDYPLLAFQALRPVPVGTTYATLQDLPDRVQEVKARHRELKHNFEEYFRARSSRSVGAQLAQQWHAHTRPRAA